MVELNWTGYSILWLVAYSCVLSCIFYTWYLHCLSCKRCKSGNDTIGVITKKWKKVDKGDGEGADNEKYFVAYKFDDKRPEITTQCIYIVIDNYTYHKFSDDIICICLQYLGCKSFTFWYGPFHKEIETSYGWYQELRPGSKIDIDYDITNPNNNIAAELSVGATRSCCAHLVIHGLLGVMIWGLNETIYNEYIVDMLLIIFAPSIFIGIISILCRCGSQKTFFWAPNRKERHLKLKCEKIREFDTA